MRKLTYSDYRRAGHNRFTSFILGADPILFWGSSVVFGIVLGLLSVYFWPVK